jgi:hypothetical protein
VLVVHLKRFSNSRSLRDKIDAMVEFPVEGLDLSRRVGERQFGVEFEKETGSLEGTGLEHVTAEPVIYDLFAVDEHMGGLGGGHYRAYALNQEDEQWYHFDDSHVSKASPEDAVVSVGRCVHVMANHLTHFIGRTQMRTCSFIEGEAANLSAGKLTKSWNPPGYSSTPALATMRTRNLSSHRSLSTLY